MNETQDILRKMLGLYWLRPENALWRCLDCLVLKNVKFKPPILDFGCGDGLFSFILAGGTLSPEFDTFSHVGEGLDKFFQNVTSKDCSRKLHSV